MTRKTISLLALTLLFTAGFAFASPETIAAPGEPVLLAAPEAPPALSDLQALLGADSCKPQPASVKPGCSRTCHVPQDCRRYPEETCVNGCCLF